MIRLSEARAKAELREEITASDAKDIVEIMKHSLWESYKVPYILLIYFAKNRTRMAKLIFRGPKMEPV